MCVRSLWTCTWPRYVRRHNACMMMFATILGPLANREEKDHYRASCLRLRLSPPVTQKSDDFTGSAQKFKPPQKFSPCIFFLAVLTLRGRRSSHHGATRHRNEACCQSRQEAKTPTPKSTQFSRVESPKQQQQQWR